MTETIRLSVRSLVEHVYRSGSIEAGFHTPGSLAEGTRVHREVQRGYGEHDRKEVFLSGEIVRGDVLFVLEGRCDGLLAVHDSVVIEEIKSTSGDPRRIEENQYPVHWAQAMCYAYLYVKSNANAAAPQVRLTYVQVDTGERNVYERITEIPELERFMEDTLDAYLPFARMAIRHTRQRDDSIARLEFPFETFRPGQRKLAGAAYKAIEEGVGLFAQAPTGTGKTASMLYPAVKAVGHGKLGRFFYLTAKSTTRAAAEDTLALMERRGLRLHAVSLTAKEKVCFREEIACSGETCEYADGYYDRINGALLDMLSAETRMTRPVIEAYARKHRVCPFEFSLDAAYLADAVICDYNYVFDPKVSLRRLTAERKKQTALLADEAHNLVDRAREMFSAELRKSDFLALQREFKHREPAVGQAAKAVNAFFIAMRKQREASGHNATRGWIRSVREAPAELLSLAAAFARQAEITLARSNPPSPLLLDTYYAAQDFVRIGDLFDERFAVLETLTQNEATVKLFCLDPSHLLRQAGRGYRSRIFFSATLTPAGYFMDMLGAESDDYRLAVPSPFSREQWEVTVVPLSTRFADRERSIRPIAELLKRQTERRPGRYLFFFPSYEYMNAVYGAFSEEPGSAVTMTQHPGMTEEERDLFLRSYDADVHGNLAGFAVLGGVFSEGIDLARDRLTGVAVIGVGLPQVGPEREMLKRHFDETGKDGFEYAYVFPGMNKVLQAGGRLIRSAADRGTLLLVDDRYLQRRYRGLLPREWVE